MKKVFFLIGLISFLISCKHKRDENKVVNQQSIVVKDSVFNNKLEDSTKTIDQQSEIEYILEGICDTTFLKDGSFLFYQFNKDSIWLTIKYPNGKSNIIDLDTTKEIFSIYGRLKHTLIKEYNDKLLFRYGCAATGGLCGYKLIETKSVKTLNDYTNLIYFDEKSDFFIDLNDKTDSISVIIPDFNKIVTVCNNINIPIYYSVPDTYFTFEKKVKTKIYLTYFDSVNYPKYPDGREMYFIIDLQNKTSEIRPKN